jgi:hypothetical protein
MGDENQPVYPTVGWESYALTHGEAVLALHYVPGVPPIGTTTEQMREARLVQRFGLTAEQCDELAQLLILTASRSRARRGSAN